MDFLALFISAKLTGRTVRPLRYTLAALLGAVYALSTVIAEQYINGGLFTAVFAVFSIICATVMVKCAFGGGLRDTVRGTLTYGGVNVGLGGIMTVLYSLVGRFVAEAGINMASPSPEASPALFMIIALISGAVSLLYGKYRKKSTVRQKVEAVISAFGKECRLTLLCDSGNLLRDPFSVKPVTVISAKGLEGIIPDTLLNAASTPEQFILTNELPSGIRLIPAGGVGGKTMLFGFVPEKVSIDGTSIETVIAIDTESDEYDGCEGLISPEALPV